MTTAASKNIESLVKYRPESLQGLISAIHPTTTVHTNRPPPKSAPMLTSALPVLVKPMMEEKMSGAPLARATRVTPAKLLLSFHFSEIVANVGVK